MTQRNADDMGLPPANVDFSRKDSEQISNKTIAVKMDSREYLAKMIADLPIVEQLLSTGIPRGVAMYLSVTQRDVIVDALRGVPATERT